VDDAVVVPEGCAISRNGLIYKGVLGWVLNVGLPMQRPYHAADLIALDLQRKAGFVAVEATTMHQQAGGLVDGDKPVATVENR